MTEKTIKTHTPRERNNSTVKGEFTYEYEEFNWEKFKKLPNAVAFVKKIYERQTRELARKAQSPKESISPSDYETMEAVILKTISITKKQIGDWFDTQNWDSIEALKNDAIKKQKVKSYLMTLAREYAPENNQIAQSLALKIIDVCDKQTDEVAEYLWSKLTHVQSKDDPLSILGI